MSLRGNVKLAVAFSVLVGALCVAPFLLASRDLGDVDQGLPFLYSDDEDVYLSRMQEIADGYPKVGSAYFYEYKNERVAQLPLGEYVYVAASRLTGLTLPQTLIAAKFFLPSILFLLVYVFLYRLLPAESSRLRTAGALAGSLIAVIGYDFVSVAEIARMLSGGDIGVRLSLWTRPVNPILGAIGVFGWLLLAWEVYVNARWWKSLFAGLLLGSLVFYFFAWGFAISVLAFFGGFLLLQKDWRRVRHFGLVLLVSFLVSAPYWYSVLFSMGGEESRAFALRNGMFFSHAPLMNKTLLAGMAVFLAGSAFIARRNGEAWKRLSREPWWMMSASLLLGGLWALNQQILTGRMIWPYHFVQYTEPVVVIVSVVIAMRIVGTRFAKPAMALCLFFGSFVLMQAALATGSYHSAMPEFRARQQQVGLYNWLNAKSSKDCVVLVASADELLVRPVPAFTSCNLYLVPWVISGVPPERIKHNFLVFMRFLDVKPEGAEAWLREHHSWVRGYFYEDWNQMFKTTQDEWSDQKAKELAEAYAEFYKRPLLETLRRYRLDYLVTEGPLPAKLKVELDPLILVDTFGSLHLYRWEDGP